MMPILIIAGCRYAIGHVNESYSSAGDICLKQRVRLTAQLFESSKKVELSDVVPDYYDFDEADLDEWDGWEAREVSSSCVQANVMHGPNNYTRIFEFFARINTSCEQMFLFVSNQ